MKNKVIQIRVNDVVLKSLKTVMKLGHYETMTQAITYLIRSEEDRLKKRTMK